MRLQTLRVHEIKVQPEYFKTLRDGEKPFEVRPADRDFRIGDYLLLTPFEPRKPETEFEGRVVSRITYRMDRSDTFGKKALKDGWCILGLARAFGSDETAITDGISVHIVPPLATKKKSRR